MLSLFSNIFKNYRLDKSSKNKLNTQNSRKVKGEAQTLWNILEIVKFIGKVKFIWTFITKSKIDLQSYRYYRLFTRPGKRFINAENSAFES